MLYRAAVVCLAALLIAGSSLAGPIFFSVDVASPSVPGVSNNDVLAPGPVAGPPAVATPAGALGLPPADELDAMTTGAPVDPLAIFFSVDRGAAGLPPGGPAPDVFSEALAGQAAGDVFVSGGGGQQYAGLQPGHPRPAASRRARGIRGRSDRQPRRAGSGRERWLPAYSLLAGNSFGLSRR